MMSFSEFADSVLSAYGIYQTVLLAWGIAALTVWSLGPHRQLPAVLETHPAWQFAPFDVRYNGLPPRPADIVKLLFFTFCPALNVLMMGPALIIFAVTVVYRTCGAGVRVVSRWATGDANRVKNWFFTPIGHD